MRFRAAGKIVTRISGNVSRLRQSKNKMADCEALATYYLP